MSLSPLAVHNQTFLDLLPVVKKSALTPFVCEIKKKLDGMWEMRGKEDKLWSHTLTESCVRHCFSVAGDDVLTADRADRLVKQVQAVLYTTPT